MASTEPRGTRRVISRPSAHLSMCLQPMYDGLRLLTLLLSVSLLVNTSAVLPNHLGLPRQATVSFPSKGFGASSTLTRTCIEYVPSTIPLTLSAA